MVNDLYDVAAEVTDGVLGIGTYAYLNRHHPNPAVQAAIRRQGGRVIPPTTVQKQDYELYQGLLLAQLALRNATGAPAGDRIVHKMAEHMLIKIGNMIKELEREGG
jgi:hypothetical protein